MTDRERSIYRVGQLLGLALTGLALGVSSWSGSLLGFGVGVFLTRIGVWFFCDAERFKARIVYQEMYLARLAQLEEERASKEQSPRGPPKLQVVRRLEE